MPKPIVLATTFSKDGLDDLRSEVFGGPHEELVLDRPVVYVIWAEARKSVYVGETNDIVGRTRQHLKDHLGHLAGSARLFVIAHGRFNKSATLDLEDKLLERFSVQFEHATAIDEESITVLNSRGNAQRSYYDSTVSELILHDAWDALRQEMPNLWTRLQIEHSAIFKNSPFKKLTKRQHAALRDIVEAIEAAASSPAPEGSLVLVSGRAGTGKTVLMSTLFFDLARRVINSPTPSTPGSGGVHLVVNHEKQLQVYQQVARRLGLTAHSCVKVERPTTWINAKTKADRERKAAVGEGEDLRADVVIVDEAHLLLTQEGQGWNKHGSRQLDALQRLAKVIVVVLDTRQTLTSEQYCEPARVEEIERSAVATIPLTDQLRIDAPEPVVDWIDALGNGVLLDMPAPQDRYDLRVFDSPAAMQEEIRKKSFETDNGLSRMLATYDWKYSRKPGPEMTWNVRIGTFSMPWNYEIKVENRGRHGRAWAEDPVTIDEIGSTFSIQGFDLNYAGVILGSSITWRDGQIVIDPAQSQNSKAKNRRSNGNGEMIELAEQNILNEFYVLITRGAHGLFLYAVDEGLQEALLAAQSRTLHRGKLL